VIFTPLIHPLWQSYQHLRSLFALCWCVLIAALTCFASLTRLHHITDSDTRQGLWALLLTSGGWAAAHVGFLVSPTTSLKLGWYTLGLVLGLAAVGAWLYFCSAYTGRTYHRNPTYRRLAIAVYIALVAVKVTNPLHREYFTTTVVATPRSSSIRIYGATTLDRDGALVRARLCRLLHAPGTVHANRP